jgi:glycogen operon protein
MLLMGDEMRRTQHGNNNAYCHDNEISWLDWRLLDRHPDVYRFVCMLSAFRQRRDVVADGTSLSLNELLARARVVWHGVTLEHPDWGDLSHSLAFTMQSVRARYLLHALVNAYWEPLTFELPPVENAGRSWRRCIDTAAAPPHEILRWSDAPAVRAGRYRAQARSVVLLALNLERGGDDVSHARAAV